MSANPLRQPKPSPDESLYRGRFYFADEAGQLAGPVGFGIALSQDLLWVNDELSVPLHAVRAAEIFEAGVFPRRRALKIVYENPITGLSEAVVLVKLDFFGFYALKPLQELKEKVEAARARATRPVPRPTGSLLQQEVDACEACGEKPASYVGYTFLVSALVFSYRSAVRRRVHCRRHNLIHGFGHYGLTAALGWLGIGIFAYPFMVFASARSLEPSLGRPTVWALTAVPVLSVAGLVLHWLHVI